MSNYLQAGSFNVKAFLAKLLFHWPLYLVILTACFCLAAFYLRYKRPVYQVYAKVMIKEEKEAGKVALEALDLSESETSIDAQMGLMSSIPVNKKVVEDLQLWVTYHEPTEYYSYRDLYVKTPVKFKFTKAAAGPLYATMNIIIESDSTYRIKLSDENTPRFHFDEVVKNGIGSWMLQKNSNLKDFIGHTVQIRVKDVDDVVGYYQNSIMLMPNTKSSTITLRLDDEVPERGREVLNYYIRVYMAASIDQKRVSAQNTLKFVDERLGSITQELNNVESRYEGYKSNRGITEIYSQSSVYVGSDQQNQTQINDVKIKLSVVEGIEHYLNADEGKGALPSTLGVNDAGLQGLMDRLNDLLLEKTRMLSQLPETNPLFNPINQQINAARNSLRENVRTTKIALSQTLRHLQSVGSGYQSSIRNIPGQERDLVDIKRMQSIKENLYVYLLQKKEELSLDYASTIADAAIIDLAHSGAQSAPIPKSVYAMAFLLGLIMPTGIIYGREALKSRIQAKQEITAATGLDVLCELSDSETADPIVVNQKSYIGEQFRELRTKLNYLHGNSNPGRTTLFTSSIAGEGKSFVLSNLGAVFAAAGKKTILVELDLRRPTLSTRFSLPNPNLGITDYIIGNAAASEIIQQSEVSKNLHIICGGSIPPNPSELLESKILTDLINELKNKYDHILIDTPPVHLLTDAMIITHLCDISLYITRYNYTPKQELEYIREIYNGKKLPRLSVIFNSVKIDSQNSSYLYQKNAYIKAPSKTFKTRVKKFISRF